MQRSSAWPLTTATLRCAESVRPFCLLSRTRRSSSITRLFTMTPFPGNKAFAFSIFDDTDSSMVENVGPVYRLLHELGLRTTKSVWPLASVQAARFAGGTLQDPVYRDFIRELQAQGFEIGLHGFRNDSTTRPLVERGFSEFQRWLGTFPRTHTNHSRNRDGVYWGDARLSGVGARALYNVATRFTRHNFYEGHLEHSPFFWGDLCKAHISYVRNFVFADINLKAGNSRVVYHDRTKPFVNFWFTSCDGGDLARFCRLISEPNQDRLEAESGTCIVYTHFASGFCDGKRVNPRFETLLRRLVGKNGWFVAVADLLDFELGGCHPTIPPSELAALEFRWLWQKLRTGTS